MKASELRLKTLTGCGDAVSLKSAINDMCAAYGKVAYIDVMTMAQAEKRWALCLLRLESEAQERALMHAWDVRRFGDDLVMVVDLARQPQAGAP